MCQAFFLIGLNKRISSVISQSALWTSEFRDCLVGFSFDVRIHVTFFFYQNLSKLEKFLFTTNKNANPMTI